MPPARPRVDDSRSESSSVIATHKDRTLGGGISKAKRNGLNTNADTSSTLKTAAVNGALAVTNGTTDSPGDETPQTNWSSISIPVLHTYRAAYKIPTPASYTRPHAELIYNSSDIAKRSPSQVLARRKEKDLKLHRKKLAQTNGITRSSKLSRGKSKDKDRDASSENSSRDGRRKHSNGTYLHPLSNGDMIAQSIEPTSPTIASISGLSDSAPSTLLNISNPEATIIGRQSPTALATNIRKHFNAQPLHEQETIARFTYIMRQQGHGNAILPSATSSGNNPTSNNASTVAASRTLLPTRVEGSGGDGAGWIMGSMGREVRAADSGGGAFRLRFRPPV